jgi:DNA mismatch repair protein PMS2
VGKLHNELFIFDQHACDEKYTFEMLQKNLSIKVQPLIQPIQMNIPAIDEDIVLNAMQIFQQNGFHFDFCADDLPGSRLRLKTVPFSKFTFFGLEGRLICLITISICY